MDIYLQGASTAEELIPLEDPRSHYAWSKIFEAKGWAAKRRNKERLKLLQNLDAALDEILHEGERVESVTWGDEYSLLDEYFFRAWAHFMNRRVLLLTNERLILLQVTFEKKLRALKSQVRWSAIKKIKIAWHGMVMITPKQGKRLDLVRVPRAVKKPFVAALETQRKTAHVSNVVTREHLCPHCYEPLAELALTCPKCRGTFKSPLRASGLSLLFPGLGNWYLGYRWLGVFEVAWAFFFWAMMVQQMVEETGATTESALAAAVPFATFIGILHGADAWLTGHTAKKGLYPEKPGAAAR